MYISGFILYMICVICVSCVESWWTLLGSVYLLRLVQVSTYLQCTIHMEIVNGQLLKDESM